MAKSANSEAGSSFTPNDTNGSVNNSEQHPDTTAHSLFSREAWMPNNASSASHAKTDSSPEPVGASSEPGTLSKIGTWCYNAADVAANVTEGAAKAAYSEVTQHPGQLAIHVLEGVAIGAGIISVNPLAKAWGAGARVAGGIKMATDAALIGLGVVGTSAALSEVETAINNSAGDVNLIMHQDHRTAAEINEAKQNLQQLTGFATVDAATVLIATPLGLKTGAGIAGATTNGIKVLGQGLTALADMLPTGGLPALGLVGADGTSAMSNIGKLIDPKSLSVEKPDLTPPASSRGSGATPGGGASADSSTRKDWADARVGNANQDRKTTPEDRALANIAEDREAATRAWAETQNFKDLNLVDVAASRGKGNYGARVEEALATARIKSTAALVQKSESQLRQFPGITDNALSLIKEALSRKGLKLAAEQPKLEVESYQFSETRNVRIVNSLTSKGISDFDTLAARYNSGSLANINGLGPKGVEAVRQALIKQGYEVKDLNAIPDNSVDKLVFNTKSANHNTRTIAKLKDAGISTTQDLIQSADSDKLTSLGLGPEALQSVIRVAQQLRVEESARIADAQEARQAALQARARIGAAPGRPAMTIHRDGSIESGTVMSIPIEK